MFVDAQGLLMQRFRPAGQPSWARWSDVLPCLGMDRIMLWGVRPLGNKELLWSNDLEVLQTSPCSRASWLAEDDPDGCDSRAKAFEAEARTSLLALAMPSWLWCFFWKLVAFTPARGKVLNGSKTIQCWKLSQKRSRPCARCLGSDTPLLALTTSAYSSWARGSASQQWRLEPKGVSLLESTSSPNPTAKDLHQVFADRQW